MTSGLAASDEPAVARMSPSAAMTVAMARLSIGRFLQARRSIDDERAGLT